MVQDIEEEDEKTQKKRKPVAETDPNNERKRQGRRLVISQIPADKLPKIAIIGAPPPLAAQMHAWVSPHVLLEPATP